MSANSGTATSESEAASRHPATASAAPGRRGNRWLAVTLILLAYSVLLGYLFRQIVIGFPFASTDLAAHNEIISRMVGQLHEAQLVFFDRSWFGGWAAFQFYGFLAHIGTAILSLPARLISDTPVVMASHWLIYLGFITLPFSVFHAGSALTGHSTPKPAMHSLLLAVFSGAVSVWFLYNGIPLAGIGATAVLNYGLFTQLFGWHLLLLNFGFLARSITIPSRHRFNGWLTMGLVALVLTHPLSAAAFLFFALFAFLYFDINRRQLLYTYLLAIGMVCFWVLPFSMLLNDYTLAGASPTDRHLVDLLFRAPGVIPQLASGMPKWMPVYDLAPTLLVSLAAIWIIFYRSSEPFSGLPFLVLIILLSGLFMSNRFASLLPVPFPYERFNGLLVLLLMPIVAAIPTEIYRATRYRGIAAMLLIAIGVSITANKITLNSPLNQQLARAAQHQPSTALEHEQSVINFFAATASKGRVFFEWFDKPHYPAHRQRFMEARLLKQTGFETANGLFTHSSPPYLYTILPALGLGAVTNAGYVDEQGTLRRPSTPEFEILDTQSLQLSPAVLLQRLARQGVSHVVAGGQRFKENLSLAGAELLARFGPYSIYQIGRYQAAEFPSHEPIGYIDLNGKLPFQQLALYLYSQPSVPDTTELIELEYGRSIPDEINRVIINGPTTDSTEPNSGLDATLDGRQLLVLDYQGSVNRQILSTISRQKRQYQDIKNYLNKQFSQHPQFLDARPLATNPVSPVLKWSYGGQSFSVMPLQSSGLLRIKYNYFPHWHSSPGSIHRSGTGQIYHFSNNDKRMSAGFTNGDHIPTQAGIVISIFTFITFVYTWGVSGQSARPARQSDD